MSDQKPLSPADHCDAIAMRVLPRLRQMVAAEIEELRVTAPKAVMLAADDEIMTAAAKVGHAIDVLAQARYTRREGPARIRLERAASELRRVMQRHGRMR